MIFNLAWLTSSGLAQLYEKYGYLVHRRCLAMLQNREDAEDALQEVFLRVQKYGTLHRSQSMLAWLYAIAFNCCCDLMKRQGRERGAINGKLSEPAAQMLGSPVDSDRRAIVGAVLRKMDSKIREIGMLHHLNGMTQEEVAESTGYSRRTVGKKLKSFEQFFKCALSEAWAFDNASRSKGAASRLRFLHR
jgi:RNA polymerase sigma-70 factor (ECF subfamily)